MLLRQALKFHEKVLLQLEHFERRLLREETMEEVGEGRQHHCPLWLASVSPIGYKSDECL